MKTKPILCPQRLRHVPRQFSWIDQRLVRDGRIKGRSPEALALYLLLCTVADAQGTSYYSDASAGKMLSLCPSSLRAARRELMAAGLIAYRAPFYQVLSLEPELGTSSASAPALEVPEQRSGEVRSIGEILREMLAQAETDTDTTTKL